MSIARSKSFLRTALLALAIPVVGLPASFTLPSGTPVAQGGSVSGGVFTDPVTVNGDNYVISWDYSASFPSGTNTVFNPTVKYVGGAAIGQTDVVAISFSQVFVDPTASDWNGTYTEHIPFQLSSGVTGTGQLEWDGQSVGLITSGSGIDRLSKDLTIGGGNLTATYDLTYTFAAGTGPGALGGSSSTPEPAAALPVALGLAGIWFAIARRRRDELNKSA